MENNKLKILLYRFKTQAGLMSQVAFLLIVTIIFSTIIYSPNSASAAVSVSYLQTAAGSGDQSSYTCAACNIGAAASDRYIIVVVHTRDSGTAAKTLNSVTVGGVQATILSQVQSASTNSNIAGLAIVRMPTGTTADITITFSEVMLRAAISVYRVTGISAATPYDLVTSTASNPSGTIDVPAGGFAIGVANSGANTTASWTGLTEDYDAVVESGLNYTGAADTFVTEQNGLSVQATFGTNTNPAGIFASWGPHGTPSPSGLTSFSGAVILQEDANIVGTIAKGSGTFAIDHPLDPSNKILYHSFVESPDVKNIYDGVVTLDGKGTAVVKLPDYFETLNKDYRFLLTPIGVPAPDLFVQSSGVVNNSFTIVGGAPNLLVSWQLTGIRQDPFILANPIITEVEKSDDTLVNKGEFLFKGYETNN